MIGVLVGPWQTFKWLDNQASLQAFRSSPALLVSLIECGGCDGVAKSGTCLCYLVRVNYYLPKVSSVPAENLGLFSPQPQVFKVYTIHGQRNTTFYV